MPSLLASGVPVVLTSDGAAGEPELNPYLNIRLAKEYPGKPKESLLQRLVVDLLHSTPLLLVECDFGHRICLRYCLSAASQLVTIVIGAVLSPAGTVRKRNRWPSGETS